MNRQTTTSETESRPATVNPAAGWAYFEGRFMPLEQANINIMTHAFLYGTAVFEGIRGYSGTRDPDQIYLYRPGDHYERMRRNNRVLRMTLPGSPSEMVETTRELLRAGEFHCDVYIRAITYKSARRIGVNLDDQQEFTVFALPMGEKYLRGGEGIHVSVSSWRRVEDNAIPSRAKINGSYVNLALGADEARSNGFDEALLLNEDGHLSEGAGMNLCLVRGKNLVTPGATCNILEGITRDSVRRLAASELGMETVSRNVDRSELYTADEVFLCGTAAEIAAVISVDRRPVGDGKMGPVTREVMRLYELLTRGGMPAHRDWLVPVY